MVLVAAHGSHEPEPEADEAASGVATVDQAPQVLEAEAASGVDELAAPVHGSHELLESESGVELVEQEVEVLVQTGTEMVHGQSVTVRVVEAVMV